MFSTLLILSIGIVLGISTMYIIARNSPKHFLKYKTFIDETYNNMSKTVSKQSTVGDNK
jgi:hypothetical protein